MNANPQALAADVAAENTDTKRIPAVDSRILTNKDGQPFGVEFIFGGDRTRRIEVNYHNLSPDIQLMAALHGLKQKIGDAAAISRNPETGKSATAEDKFQASLEIANRIKEGEWNKRRTAGGGAGGSLLVRALIRMHEGRMDEAQVRAWLDGKTDKEKAALRTNPEVMRVINDIRAEDGKDKYVGGDLLAELAQLSTPAEAEKPKTEG